MTECKALAKNDYIINILVEIIETASKIYRLLAFIELQDTIDTRTVPISVNISGWLHITKEKVTDILKTGESFMEFHVVPMNRAYKKNEQEKRGKLPHWYNARKTF